MEMNAITGIVIERAIHIHRELGPGLLESVYQKILIHEVQKSGMNVDSEVAIPICWDGVDLATSFRADLAVEGRLLLELKRVEQTLPVHRKQTLTYLKLSKLSVGLLINFGSNLLKNDMHRLVNGPPV